MKAQYLLALTVVISLPTISSGQIPTSRPRALPSAPSLAAPITAPVQTPTDPEQPATDATNAADAEEAKQKAEQVKRKQARMKMIQRLQFDRRPSAILQAWAESNKEPEAKEEKEDEEKPKPKSEISPSTTEPVEPAPDPDWFDEGIKIFQRDVTLGNWPNVKHFLIDLPEDEGKALYQRLLQTLQGVPAGMPNLPQELQAQFAEVQAMQAQRRGRNPEKNIFKFDDVIALADVAPLELDDSMLRSLAVMIRATLSNGNVIEQLTPWVWSPSPSPTATTARYGWTITSRTA